MDLVMAAWMTSSALLERLNRWVEAPTGGPIWPASGQPIQRVDGAAGLLTTTQKCVVTQITYL
jgi:hypothetical protein